MWIHEKWFYGGLLTSARQGKLVDNGKACEEAQMEEEDKVHDDSQTEAVICKPAAKHKGNCPLQTNSTKQGRWSFLKQNLKIRRNPMLFGSKDRDVSTEIGLTIPVNQHQKPSFH